MVLFWPEISALGVFYNFDNERTRPSKYPSAPPPPPPPTPPPGRILRNLNRMSPSSSWIHTYYGFRISSRDLNIHLEVNYLNPTIAWKFIHVKDNHKFFHLTYNQMKLGRILFKHCSLSLVLFWTKKRIILQIPSVTARGKYRYSGRCQIQIPKG